jgi:hypothetical protein
MQALQTPLVNDISAITIELPNSNHQLSSNAAYSAAVD